MGHTILPEVGFFFQVSGILERREPWRIYDLLCYRIQPSFKRTSDLHSRRRNHRHQHTFCTCTRTYSTAHLTRAPLCSGSVNFAPKISDLTFEYSPAGAPRRATALDIVLWRAMSITSRGQQCSGKVVQGWERIWQVEFEATKTSNHLFTVYSCTATIIINQKINWEVWIL